MSERFTKKGFGIRRKPAPPKKKEIKDPEGAGKKKLPLLPQEKTSLFNSLNQMSMEQLRKYVSRFNKEARIVGGHAMSKDKLINAIIEKAKKVEELLTKLRTDAPKLGKFHGYKTTGEIGEDGGKKEIAIDKDGNKIRMYAPAPVKVGDVKQGYKEIKKVGGKGVFLAGYANKGNVASNRFETMDQARKACDKNGNCNGITFEKVRGKEYYSMRNGITPQNSPDGKEYERSWRKYKQTRLKK